jgi:hypothetical protein
LDVFRIYGEILNEDIADGFHSLGIVCYEKKMVAEGAMYCEDAMKMYRKFIGHDHPKLGGALYDLAMAKSRSRDHPGALACARECFRIFNMLDMNPAKTQRMGDMIRGITGMQAKAARLHAKLLSSRRYVDTVEHPGGRSAGHSSSQSAHRGSGAGSSSRRDEDQGGGLGEELLSGFSDLSIGQGDSEEFEVVD